jgi:hypothetical protein
MITAHTPSVARSTDDQPAAAAENGVLLDPLLSK